MRLGPGLLFTQRWLLLSATVGDGQKKKNLAAFHLSFVSGLDTRKQCSRSAAGSLAQERLMQEYLKAETKIDRVEIRR